MKFKIFEGLHMCSTLTAQKLADIKYTEAQGK